MALALKGLLYRKSPHIIVKRSLLCFPIDAVVYLRCFINKKKATLYSIHPQLSFSFLWWMVSNSKKQLI